MVRNPARKNKLRSTLIVIIFATLPCYLLGMIVLWIGNSVINQQNITPTVTMTVTLDPWGGIPTSTLPAIPTSPVIETETPTIPATVTATITYVIPSNTPTLSPTPSATATATETPIATVVVEITAP
jgi:hypothetical protein